MEVTQEMFNAKLNELSESYERMQQQIAHIQNADPDEVRQIRTHLEAEWADTVVELKNRAKMMRFLTAQQLSQVQMEYCRKAADIFMLRSSNLGRRFLLVMRAMTWHCTQNMRLILQPSPCAMH